MFIVHVHIHVKPDRIQDFIQATRENAIASLKEKGVKRFDVFQLEESSEFFILEEAYVCQADAGSHKDTPHYKKWKNAMESMMAEPRRSIRLKNLYPEDQNW